MRYVGHVLSSLALTMLLYFVCIVFQNGLIDFSATFIPCQSHTQCFTMNFNIYASSPRCKVQQPIYAYCFNSHTVIIRYEISSPGTLSDNTDWRSMEKDLGNEAIFVSYSCWKGCALLCILLHFLLSKMMLWCLFLIFETQKDKYIGFSRPPCNQTKRQSSAKGYWSFLNQSCDNAHWWVDPTP